MRLPEETIGLCRFIFDVVGFGVVSVGFGVSVVESTSDIKKMSYNFCISMANLDCLQFSTVCLYSYHMKH